VKRSTEPDGSYKTPAGEVASNVRYFLVSNDQSQAAQWRERLEERGFEVTAEYDPDATILTLGGDGTILYAARSYAEPTILPVRTGNSEGNQTRLELGDLLTTLAGIESGEIDLARTRYDTLEALVNGEPISGGFRALNEISLHHAAPVLAAEFGVRVEDRGRRYEFERVVGDGALVATPFGSTGYYESITGGSFTAGFGLAFNNVHRPRDVPQYLGLSTDAVVEFELLELSGASPVVLTRDEDRDAYELSVGDPVEVRRGEKTVEIVGPA